VTYKDRNRRVIQTLQPAARIAGYFVEWKLDRIGEDVLFVEGHRDSVKQRQEVLKGTSSAEWPFSYHNHGAAIDLVPVKFRIASTLLWGSKDRYHKIATVMKRWGWRWGFDEWGYDMPHFHFTQGHDIADFVKAMKENRILLDKEEIRMIAVYEMEADIERMRSGLRFVDAKRRAALLAKIEEGEEVLSLIRSV
jgi:hypothetical protein